MSSKPAVALGDLKQMIHRFASERSSWPRDAAASEFGALVLYVIQQADRLQIDLVAAGEAHVTRESGRVPRLVPPPHNLDA